MMYPLSLWHSLNARLLYRPALKGLFCSMSFKTDNCSQIGFLCVPRSVPIFMVNLMLYLTLFHITGLRNKQQCESDRNLSAPVGIWMLMESFPIRVWHESLFAVTSEKLIISINSTVLNRLNSLTCIQWNAFSIFKPPSHPPPHFNLKTLLLLKYWMILSHQTSVELLSHQFTFRKSDVIMERIRKIFHCVNKAFSSSLMDFSIARLFVLNFWIWEIASKNSFSFHKFNTFFNSRFLELQIFS